MAEGRKKEKKLTFLPEDHGLPPAAISPMGRLPTPDGVTAAAMAEREQLLERQAHERELLDQKIAVELEEKKNQMADEEEKIAADLNATINRFRKALMRSNQLKVRVYMLLILIIFLLL